MTIYDLIVIGIVTGVTIKVIELFARVMWGLINLVSDLILARIAEIDGKPMEDYVPLFVLLSVILSRRKHG